MHEDPQDLISVYQATSPIEAYLVRDLLVDENIDAQVSEANEPLAGLSIAAADVLVRRSDLARAQAIVEDYDRKKIERAERPEWKCPKCGATVLGAYDECDVCGTLRPGIEE
jgi:rubrerythrin